MIYIKSQDEIEKIRECGTISANFFKYVKQFIEEGITTLELDRIAEDFIIKNGGTPSFKGYHDYPFSICASVNEEIIHGLPSKRKLKNGDVIGVDVGVKKDGMISDSAYTFAVGQIPEELKLLVERTEKSLYKAIGQIKESNLINDVCGAVEDFITPFGYGIVADYCGHGVGYQNHEEPEFPNYRYTKGNRPLKKGMVIAIEPMINLGSEECFVLEDGWTVVTVDGKYSAHFEHSIAVTDKGFDILTIHPDDLDSINNKFF